MNTQMQQGSSVPNPWMLATILRAVTGLTGLFITLTGLFCGLRVFNLVLETLQNPKGFTSVLAGWVLAVGGEKLDLNIGGTMFHSAEFLALFVIGIGCWILASIANGLIAAGARAVSLALKDINPPASSPSANET